jgi:hypothetical protein
MTEAIDRLRLELRVAELEEWLVDAKKAGYRGDVRSVAEELRRARQAHREFLGRPAGSNIDVKLIKGN